MTRQMRLTASEKASVAELRADELPKPLFRGLSITHRGCFRFVVSRRFGTHRFRLSLQALTKLTHRARAHVCVEGTPSRLIGEPLGKQNQARQRVAVFGAKNVRPGTSEVSKGLGNAFAGRSCGKSSTRWQPNQLFLVQQRIVTPWAARMRSRTPKGGAVPFCWLIGLTLE